MKVVFHPKFLDVYDDTPAGSSHRLEPALELLKENSDYQFIIPEPATRISLERVHSVRHIESVELGKEGGFKHIYEYARLSAGASIKCAEIASRGEPSFALIRPPGHHASRDSAWGFCYFNNIAVSLLHLNATTEIKRAYILDFDLHEGDGNINILSKYDGYEIYNPDGRDETDYLANVQNSLKNAQPCDIIVASAGFDQGLGDWGNLLGEDAYFKIGRMMKDFSIKNCNGRRYALLEGGYNPEKIAVHLRAFCKGFA